MALKKGVFFVFLMLFSFSLASAVDLSISQTVVRDTIINDHNVPAVFDFKITNGMANWSNFEIYTFERFKISPSEFSVSPGETVNFSLEFLPLDSMKKNKGHLRVPVFFRVKGTSNPIQEDVSIKLVEFSEAFDIGGVSINPDFNSAEIFFYNVENIQYENISITFSSDFFDDYTNIFSFAPYEKKNINILLNKEKLKKLVFGSYDVFASVTVSGKTVEISGSLKIVEKSGISIEERSEGIIVRKTVMKKTNEGNIPTVAEVSLEKNIISRLFTSFSPEPNKIERGGVLVYYSWQKELSPDESLEVTVSTNYIFPFLVIVAIIILAIIANMYFTTHLVIKKNVSFVKTKSNNFALKVTLRVKARNYMERVRIYDQLPMMAKLFEGYGSTPDKFQNGRLNWDVGRLTAGEERVFSYVFYSKLRVIGKFELPCARGVYDILGKTHEASSNKVFFINEPVEFKEED